MALVLILAGLFLSYAAGTQQPVSRPPALILELNGAIGPATSDYVKRGLHRAAQRRAPLVVIQMDTPGGLDTAMRAMIRDILASTVPVATYVSPSGARAASAGTFILYASHIAAMAPGTNVGAATPVRVGGLPGAPGGDDKGGQASDKSKNQGADQTGRSKPNQPTEAKAVNDAAAYLRALAELRGRNADWPERAVRDADSLSAKAALAQRVVDIEARNIEDLLTQAHGRAVTVAGRRIVLNTHGVGVETIAPGWRTNVLTTITNPNVALILMVIGIYGLIFEFMHPGALYPGTIGGICLLVAFYAFAALPVSHAGIGLILLGIGLMIAEAFTPSLGILGIGGAVAFALGATILIDTDIPQFRIAWEVIGGLAVLSLVFSVAVARLALNARRRDVVSGREEMIGSRGVVQDWDGGKGHVLVHSERWNAVSAAPLQSGDPIRVVALDGLVLRIEPESTAPTFDNSG